MAKQRKEKNGIKNWRPFLYYYKEIVGVECKTIDDLGKLISRMTGDKLVVCPFETTGYTLIIPKLALRYLKIDNDDIQHSFVELIQMDHLSEEIVSMIAKRFYNDLRPNYYETQNIVSRSFVKKEVAEEITEILAKNKSLTIF